MFSPVNIDQTEAFAAMDLKGPLRRADDYVADALATFSSNVKRRAQQGDQMMRIENGGWSHCSHRQTKWNTTHETTYT